MDKKTLVFVYGTRPEFIKIVPIILEARKRDDLNVVLCSTGQHREMLAPLYRFFEVKPDIDFELMRPNQSLVSLHAETMLKTIEVIEVHKPSWIVVQGDTTSAHAAAMAAFYMKVPVAHVEAGLRTHDIHSPFPEEMNRRAISLTAKAHFCPTPDALKNLEKEGTGRGSFLEVTGNTGIDTLTVVSNKIDNSSALLQKFIQKYGFLNFDRFILATVHRRESFGASQIEILKAFLHISKKHKVDILFPVHPNPNVRKSVDEVFGAEIGKSVRWVEDENEEVLQRSDEGRIFLLNPMDYPALVFLMKRCLFLMTDSGGLQEEAPTFGKKIIVLRESTERPEGVKAGFSHLVGTKYDNIVGLAESLLGGELFLKSPFPKNPYGNGGASNKILHHLTT